MKRRAVPALFWTSSLVWPLETKATSLVGWGYLTLRAHVRFRQATSLSRGGGSTSRICHGRSQDCTRRSPPLLKAVNAEQRVALDDSR